jgi:hypothetical protein
MLDIPLRDAPPPPPRIRVSSSAQSRQYTGNAGVEWALCVVLVIIAVVGV